MQAKFPRWLLVTACCLAVAGCVPKVRKNGLAQKAAVAEKKAATPIITPITDKEPRDVKKTVPTWIVEGWGKTEEDAQKFAVQKIRNKLAADLNPPLEWRPPAEFIVKSLLTGPPQRRADQDMQINGEQMQCWAWTVPLGTSQLEQLRLEDAKYRAELTAEKRVAAAKSRMVHLGKLVGLMVLSLIGVSLYIRLDRWMESSKRRWLRIALTCVVAGAGLVWFLR
jgi:hypothetical protein